MRWLSLAAGVALVAVAFAAATHVADTREGLISEAITLLAGLVGISLILYGFFAGARPGRPNDAVPRPSAAAVPTTIRSASQLLVGAGGLALAAVLLGGLAISGGVQWVGLGLVMLLPMVAGSAYLCARFLRAPDRKRRLDLKSWRRRKD